MPITCYLSINCKKHGISIQIILVGLYLSRHLLRGHLCEKVLVTGCAGFIGSNLVDRLLENGNKVVGIDNLSTGHLEFLDSALSNQNFTFHEIDLQETNSLVSYFNEIDTVFHLAANADVRFGAENLA